VIDVAIVGGGPAGLLAARRLARAGCDVVVFEEHRRIGWPTHCTGIVSVELTELAKIPDDIVLSRLQHAHLVAPGGESCDIRWSGADREEILTIDRAAFDESLAAQAIDAGADVRLGALVDGIATSRSGVAVRVDGESVAARACVLACGVSYRFQRQLGLGLPGRVLHSAQMEVDAEPWERVELYFGQRVAPEGFIWTVPIVRDGRPRLKVGAMVRGHAAKYLREFVARPEIARRLGPTPETPFTRLLPLRPITSSYATRVLAVGDAGGFTKPTTGGGIYYSLLTATLAADTLLDAFQAGRFDERFLSRYEARWQARLGHELRVGDWLRELLIKLSDRDIATLLRALATDDVQAVIQRSARFNWHRDLIVSLLWQRGIAALLFRSFFR
jgi:geranylgeranyl reductase family protein